MEPDREERERVGGWQAQQGPRLGGQKAEPGGLAGEERRSAELWGGARSPPFRVDYRRLPGRGADCRSCCHCSLFLKCER